MIEYKNTTWIGTLCMQQTTEVENHCFDVEYIVIKLQISRLDAQIMCR